MASDDEDVEAWYLEGWCCYLLAEQATESGQPDDKWQEWSHRAMDCLVTSEKVGSNDSFAFTTSLADLLRQYHVESGHPDQQILEHIQQLVAQLNELGVKQTNPDELDEEWTGLGNGDELEGDEGEWEDMSDQDQDVDMTS